MEWIVAALGVLTVVLVVVVFLQQIRISVRNDLLANQSAEFDKERESIANTVKNLINRVQDEANFKIQQVGKQANLAVGKAQCSKGTKSMLVTHIESVVQAEIHRGFDVNAD